MNSDPTDKPRAIPRRRLKEVVFSRETTTAASSDKRAPAGRSGQRAAKARSTKSDKRDQQSKRRIAHAARNFEAQVRLSARLLWHREAIQESINSVVYDVVIRISSQHWVIIETTISRDLAKVREDLNRLALARMHLLISRNVITELYIVLQEPPTPDMLATASGLNVQILSLAQLKCRLFDFCSYQTYRAGFPFGSAVLPNSGSRDNLAYVPVTYTLAGNEISLEIVCARLLSGEQIVLTGEYGTGKSRCLQEAFDRLAARADNSFKYPIAINLRECWGLETAEEIIGRHLRHLGLSALVDNVLRLLGAGSVILLLDGFDELGIQSWSDDVIRLRESRKRALRGVRQLIGIASGGLLIAGREHYFDGNVEMTAAFGMSSEASIVQCKNEFTIPEMKAYLKSRNIDRQPPEWLPRRPLMVQTLSSFDAQTLKSVLAASTGAIQFWHLFVSAFCKREARAQDDMLDAESVRRVMQMLARMTRSKPSDVGPLTQTEIRSAFDAIIGTTAIEETRVILQRLSGLGRVSTETDDRQFVDPYLLDGFRALDVDNIVSVEDKSCQRERWSNPLRPLGQMILGDLMGNRSRDFIIFAKHCVAHGNSVIASDIAAAICASSKGAADFSGLHIQDGYFFELNMHAVEPSNLTLNDCVIHRFVAPRREGANFRLENCFVETLFGELRHSPPYIVNCHVEFQKAASIPIDRLSVGQRVLLEILGCILDARQHRTGTAVIRGRASKVGSDRIVSRILEMLIEDEQILLPPVGSKHSGISTIRLNGDARHRARGLLVDMDLSNDPIWTKAGAVS